MMNLMKRRPLMFVVDSLKERKGIERQKILVDSPLGGTFRVSDGRVTADITFSEMGIQVDAVNSDGIFETIATRKV